MGLVTFNTKVIGFVSEIVCVNGENEIPLNWFGVVGAKVVEHVIYDGWFVEVMKKNKVAVIVTGWVDAGFLALFIVNVILEVELVEYREEYVKISLKKPWAWFGERTVQAPPQTDEGVNERKLERLYALQGASWTCKIEPAEIVEDGE
jgi:hypothetical protein